MHSLSSLKSCFRSGLVSSLRVSVRNMSSTASTTSAIAAATATKVTSVPYPLPGIHHSPIVDELWKARDTVNPSSIIYNFTSKCELCDRYANPWGKIRLGRILEDLDALAGSISMAHCKDSSLLLVTASVDRILVTHQPDLQQDMTMDGKVVWTGRSSMEIRMQIQLKNAPLPWLTASFIFVARDHEGKAANIPKIETATEEEKKLYRDCEAKHVRRKSQRLLKNKELTSLGLDLPPPLDEWIAVIQNLMNQGRKVTDLPTLANPKQVLISTTSLSNTLVCQGQHRNIHGRIFGGFLMRRAFELAFATAFKFSGQPVAVVEVDNVNFTCPVEIGNLLHLHAVVLYTSNTLPGCHSYKQHNSDSNSHFMHVMVDAHVIQAETVSTRLTNTFHFTFETKTDVKQVLPNSLEDAIQVVKMMSYNQEIERGF